MFVPRNGPMLAVSAAVISMTGIAAASDLPQEIIDCRTLTNADERLSCYDRVIDDETGSANSKVNSIQSEPQRKDSQTETASRAEPQTADYDDVIDEDTALASDGLISSQSEPRLDASRPETASSAQPPPAETASGEKQLVTTSAAKSSDSQEALFGMSAEEQLVVIRDEAATESIEAGVSAIRYSRYRKAVFTLDNGHVWQQMDSKKIHISENDRVVIRRGTFGSFLMNKAGAKTSIRVKRIG